METVAEIYKKYGIEYHENNEKDLSIEEIKKEITDRAINDEPGAYEAYQQAQNREKVTLYKAAEAEVEYCTEEFNNLLRRDVRKGKETPEMQESRIWLSNPDLWCRLDKAQRCLNDRRR